MTLLYIAGLIVAVIIVGLLIDLALRRPW